MNSSPRLIYLLLPQHFDRRQFLVKRKSNGQNYVLVGDVKERQRALSLRESKGIQLFVANSAGRKCPTHLIINVLSDVLLQRANCILNTEICMWTKQCLVSRTVD